MHDQETKSSYSNQKAQFFAQLLDLNLLQTQNALTEGEAISPKRSMVMIPPWLLKGGPMAIYLSNYVLAKWEYPGILRIVT